MWAGKRCFPQAGHPPKWRQPVCAGGRWADRPVLVTEPLPAGSARGTGGWRLGGSAESPHQSPTEASRLCAPSPSAIGPGSISPTRAQELLGSQVTQSRMTLCHPIDCSPPGSSVHGILWPRILEWGAICFSRGSSRPRHRTWVSRIAGRFRSFYASSQIFPGSNQILVSLLPRRPNFVRQPFSCARHSGH